MCVVVLLASWSQHPPSSVALSSAQLLHLLSLLCSVSASIHKLFLCQSFLNFFLESGLAPQLHGGYTPFFHRPRGFLLGDHQILLYTKKLDNHHITKTKYLCQIKLICIFVSTFSGYNSFFRLCQKALELQSGVFCLYLQYPTVTC